MSFVLNPRHSRMSFVLNQVYKAFREYGERKRITSRYFAFLWLE